LSWQESRGNRPLKDEGPDAASLRFKRQDRAAETRLLPRPRRLRRRARRPAVPYTFLPVTAYWSRIAVFARENDPLDQYKLDYGVLQQKFFDKRGEIYGENFYFVKFGKGG
jgi:hypothetical protein